jgi:hypothetical protein
MDAPNSVLSSPSCTAVLYQKLEVRDGLDPGAQTESMN